MGNKGSILDIFFIAFLVLVVGIVLVVSMTVLNKVSDATENSTIKLGNGSTIPLLNQSMLDRGKEALQTFDNMMPFLLVGLVLITVIFAFLIPTHPIFIIFSIIMIMIFLILIPQFSNIYGQIVTTDTLSDAGNQLTYTNEIMRNLPLIILIFSIILIIVVFIASRRGEIAG